MKTLSLREEILRLKKEKNTLILAHSYESCEIAEIADVTGDSYLLACAAKEATAREVLVCGVRFMAETVKILSPEKRVILAEKNAGCPMAEQLTAEEFKELRKKYPKAAAVTYVNTTAQLKALADVCVTSSSAVKVLSRLDAEEILFVPDSQLGRYCEKHLPQKKFYFYEGGCPVHLLAQLSDVKRARAEHRDALFLVHPECRGEVADEADYVGSTSGIMNFVKESDKGEFIIGTENTIAEHLRLAFPQKKFYSLSPALVCKDMRLTTLKSVYDCLTGGGEEIVLDEELRLSAKRSLDKMIELGG